MIPAGPCILMIPEKKFVVMRPQRYCLLMTQKNFLPTQDTKVLLRPHDIRYFTNCLWCLVFPASSWYQVALVPSRYRTIFCRLVTKSLPSCLNHNCLNTNTNIHGSWFLLSYNTRNMQKVFGRSLPPHDTQKGFISPCWKILVLAHDSGRFRPPHNTKTYLSPHNITMWVATHGINNFFASAGHQVILIPQECNISAASAVLGVVGSLHV